MTVPELFLPDDVRNETLRQLYDQAELETRIDGDGDLVVTRGVTCYAIPSPERARIMLLTFVGVKEGITRAEKLEFTNRVNNEIAAVRAHVNRKENVVFDSHIPIDGGVTGTAITAATKFFLIAIAHAIDLCDEDDIVR